jgi:phosphohistidine phosphatase SixA
MSMYAILLAVQLGAGAELRGEDLMRELQSGGYTILVRHARTDRNAPNQETPGSVPPLRSDQRNLTADGERDVRVMRDVVRKYKIPIGEVVSSPSYRCRETADAFGPSTVTMTLRAFPTTAETQALVAAPAKSGTNRVLVTHHFVIENHVPGITPGDIGESEAAVVRPTGDGKVALVGKIKLADWETLAGVAPTRQAENRVVTSPVVHGAAAPAAVVIPPTPPGRLAAGYIEAFNSGDGSRMRAFIESSLLPSPGRPTEVRVQSYLRLFEEHGPLAVTGIRSATNEGITLDARSKRGPLSVTVTAPEAEGGRAKSVTLGIHGVGGH